MDDTLRLGNVDGLDVQVEFIGFRGVGAGGTYKYLRGSEIHYRVIVRNRAPLSFRRIEVQSSLRGNTSSAALLPGPSLSMPHNFSLSPGEIYDFESTYKIPEGMLPSTGQLKVRLQYTLRDRNQAKTLTSPLHFQID